MTVHLATLAIPLAELEVRPSRSRPGREELELSNQQRSLPVAPDWRARAACCGSSHLFYDDEAPSRRAAVAICRACPVRVECLGAAMLEERGAPSRYGIRGALTPHQRYQLARTHRSAAPLVEIDVYQR